MKTVDLKSIYEERVVAFVDILGFSAMICETEKNSKEIIEDSNKIRSVLQDIKDYQRNNEDNNYKEMGSEVTIFSDSIVISKSMDWKYGDVFHTVLDMLHLQMDLLSKGILLRGGITVGNLYHRDNIVFGPAMIEAYKMESECAKYPRIIVDENIYERAKKNCPEQNTEEMEIEYIDELLYKDVDDGRLFINYIGNVSEFDCADDHSIYLSQVRELIIDGLKKSEGKVLDKYEWMKKYFNSLITPNSGMDKCFIK